jgi:hypothetical protein
MKLVYKYEYNFLLSNTSQNYRIMQTINRRFDSNQHFKVLIMVCFISSTYNKEWAAVSKS